jgi:hypothetical protein
MRVNPEDLIRTNEPDDLSALPMAELRAFRNAFQEVESGFSYARRVVQGRLDTVMAELDRRVGGDTSELDLIRILPKVLAANVRGPGLPRPTRDIDPPEWADDLLVELDEALTPRQLADIEDFGEGELTAAAERIAALERDISEARTRLHRRIDRLQEELIGRYREGASVDDLLA